MSALPRVEIAYGYLDNSRVIVDALVDDGLEGIISAGMGNGYQSIQTTEALIEAQKKRCDGLCVVVECSTGW